MGEGLLMSTFPYPAVATINDTICKLESQRIYSQDKSPVITRSLNILFSRFVFVCRQGRTRCPCCRKFIFTAIHLPFGRKKPGDYPIRHWPKEDNVDVTHPPTIMEAKRQMLDGIVLAGNVF